MPSGAEVCRGEPVSKRQHGAIRIVFERCGDYGLFWQATLQHADLYAGTPEKGTDVLLRMSYHESGATHTYYQYAEHERRRVLNSPSQPVRQLTGIEKVGGWGIPAHAAWGYEPKPDSPTRKTLILHEPLPVPLSVDLWIAEDGRSAELVAASRMPDAIKLVATLHVAPTTPELFAVVWTMADKTSQEFLSILAHIQRRGA